MTASTKPKTPTMTLPVNEDVTVAEIDKFCKSASRLALSQVVDDVQVKETLVTEDGERRRNFVVTIRFFPAKQYEEEYNTTPINVLESLGLPFGLILKKEIQVELKKLNADIKGQFANVGKGRKAPQNEAGGDGAESENDEGEDGEASGGKDEARTKAASRDDVSEVGEGDADEEKRIRQTRQQSYESDSEDDEAETVAGEDNEDTQDAEVDGDAAVPADDSRSSVSSTSSTSDLIPLIGKYLSDTCSVVVPGSFSFHSGAKSSCSFNLSVSLFFRLPGPFVF